MIQIHHTPTLDKEPLNKSKRGWHEVFDMLKNRYW